MSRAIGRAIAAAVLGGMLAAVWLALFYATRPSLTIEFDRDLPGFVVGGAHPPERDDAAGLTFAWTQGDMALRLPGLDRTVEWVMEIRLRGARPGGQPNPDLAVLADGVLLVTRASSVDFEVARITIPARPERRRGVVIGIRSSSTFVPGPDDPRELGLMVDRIRLTPAGIVLPPQEAFAGAGMAAAALGAAVALLGVTPAAAIGTAVLVSAGAAWQISRGFGPHTDYPYDVAMAALWIALFCVVLSRLAERLRGTPLRNTARFAAAFSAAALFFKVIVVIHPGMPSPSGAMPLLRSLVLAADALAGLALYAVVARAWQNRTAGAIAVALYHLVPLDLALVTIGNLTNAFAQSLSVFALALMAAAWLHHRRAWAGGALTLLLGAAFLSVTSTLPVLLLACVFASVLYWRRGGTDGRRSAGLVAAATAVAVVLAAGLYYADFGDTYRAEFSRIGAETALAAPDAGSRSIGARLGTMAYYLVMYFGLPVLVLAAAGAWHLRRAGARDSLTLVTTGWALACGVSFLIAILTPMDMRYYLALTPALAVAGARGAAAMWSAGGVSRIAALALMAGAAWWVVSGWMSVI